MDQRPSATREKENYGGMWYALPRAQPQYDAVTFARIKGNREERELQRKKEGRKACR